MRLLANLFARPRHDKLDTDVALANIFARPKALRNKLNANVALSQLALQKQGVNLKADVAPGKPVCKAKACSLGSELASVVS